MLALASASVRTLVIRAFAQIIPVISIDMIGNATVMNGAKINLPSGSFACRAIVPLHSALAETALACLWMHSFLNYLTIGCIFLTDMLI